MNILNDTLGIYGGDIERATEYANDCIEALNLDENEIIDMAQQEFSEIYNGKVEDMTNILIASVFYAIGWAVENTYGVNSEDIDYFINGMDSHIYYKKEELTSYSADDFANESAKEVDY
jgi:hypothetical protein